MEGGGREEKEKASEVVGSDEGEIEYGDLEVGESKVGEDMVESRYRKIWGEEGGVRG